MTSNIYKPIKIGKETFHPTSCDENSFVMNYKLEPGGMVPPHAHLYMDEHFSIVTGEMKFKVDGKTIIKKAGEEIFVPKGTKHSIANAGKQQAEMNVKYMPCSDTDRFFTIVATLDNIKPATMKTLMQAMYIGNKLKLKQFSHPQPLFANNIIMFIVNTVGKLSNWDKHVNTFQ